MLPFGGNYVFAEGAADTGLCKHHPEHTAECGYQEAAEAKPCQHKHDESCGYIEAVPEIPCDKGCTDTDGDGVINHAEDCAYMSGIEGQTCQHIHNEACGYAEAVEGQPCKYAADGCPKCNMRRSDVQNGSQDIAEYIVNIDGMFLEKLTNSDGSEIIDSDGDGVYEIAAGMPYQYILSFNTKEKGISAGTYTHNLPKNVNYLNQNELKGEIHADDGVKLGDWVVNNGVITYTFYQTEKEYTNVSVSIGASISFSSSSDGLVRIGNMDLKISDKAGISKTGSYRQTELTGHIGLFRYLSLYR